MIYFHMNLEEEIKLSIRDVPDFPKKGIIFKDITPLLQNADLNRKMISELKDQWQALKIDVIAGIESRGFIWGNALALELKVPFIPIRKKGKLPYQTVSQSYELEYGSSEIEMHVDAIHKGQRVLIHDDLLATGGTCNATMDLIQKAGGEVVGCSFIVELGFLNGRDNLRIAHEKLKCLVEY